MDCKSNFGHQYGDDLAYRTCGDEDTLEDENHLLVCPILYEEAYDITFNNVSGDV